MTINCRRAKIAAKMSANMSENFEKKVAEIKKIFAPLSTEQKYLKLIEMGRSLPHFPPEQKTTDRLVRGCQSQLYLDAQFREGKLFFYAYSDALISAGLAALLIAAYSGEAPETILTSPPTFLTELGITASLSPNRSNGLAHIHLRMKQEALQTFVSISKTI